MIQPETTQYIRIRVTADAASFVGTPAERAAYLRGRAEKREAQAEASANVAYAAIDRAVAAEYRAKAEEVAA